MMTSFSNPAFGSWADDVEAQEQELAQSLQAHDVVVPRETKQQETQDPTPAPAPPPPAPQDKKEQQQAQTQPPQTQQTQKEQKKEQHKDVRGILTQYFAAGSAKERSKLICGALVPQKKLSRAKSSTALAPAEGQADVPPAAPREDTTAEAVPPPPPPSPPPPPPPQQQEETQQQPPPPPPPPLEKEEEEEQVTKIEERDPGSVTQLCAFFEAAASTPATVTATPVTTVTASMDDTNLTTTHVAGGDESGVLKPRARRARSATPRVGGRSRSLSRARRRANQLDKLRKAAALARRLGAEEARQEAEGEMGDLLACLGSESKKVEALTDFFLSSCPGETRDRLQADIEILLCRVDEEAAGAAVDQQQGFIDPPIPSPAPETGSDRGRNGRRQGRAVSASPAPYSSASKRRSASPAAIASDVCRSVAVAAEEATKAAARAAEAAEVARQLMRDAAAMGINISSFNVEPVDHEDDDDNDEDYENEEEVEEKKTVIHKQPSKSRRNRRRSNSRGPKTGGTSPSPAPRGRSPVPRARQEWRPKVSP